MAIMSVEFNVKGIEELQRKFSQFEAAIKQGRVEPMEKAADKAIEIIQNRTAKSKDVGYKPFEAYSPGYAKKKKGPVDLRVSGDMLSNVKRQSWAKKARIYLGSGLLWHIGKVHNVGGRSGRGLGFSMPKREFMGVDSDKDKAVIAQVMREWWYAFKERIGL